MLSVITNKLLINVKSRCQHTTGGQWRASQSSSHKVKQIIKPVNVEIGHLNGISHVVISVAVLYAETVKSIVI